VLQELIITSGGENIPPVIIEERLKKELQPLASNVVVVGEKRKFLTCLISLAAKPDENGEPTDQLLDEVRSLCSIWRVKGVFRLENGLQKPWDCLSVRLLRPFLACSLIRTGSNWTRPLRKALKWATKMPFQGM